MAQISSLYRAGQAKCTLKLMSEELGRGTGAAPWIRRQAGSLSYIDLRRIAQRAKYLDVAGQERVEWGRLERRDLSEALSSS